MNMKVLVCLLLVCTFTNADLLSSACGVLLGVLPSNIYDPLLLPGGCAFNACGTPSGTGYFDIACNILCVGALYTNGTCTPATGTNLGSCICSGLGNQTIIDLTMGTACTNKLLGDCVCNSCGYHNGGVCTTIPNGINGTCYPN